MYERLESLFYGKDEKTQKRLFSRSFGKAQKFSQNFEIAFYTLHFLIVYKIKIRLIEQIRLSHECKIESLFIAKMKKQKRLFIRSFGKAQKMSVSRSFDALTLYLLS